MGASLSAVAKYIFSTRDYEVVGPNKLWLSINSCLHILAVKKAYFYNSLVLKYDYEFLNCILRKIKLRGGGGSAFPFPPPPPPAPRGHSLIPGSQVGLENLSNFRTPLVLKASTFCFSEQCLGKI